MYRICFVVAHIIYMLIYIFWVRRWLSSADTNVILTIVYTILWSYQIRIILSPFSQIRCSRHIYWYIVCAWCLSKYQNIIIYLHMQHQCQSILYIWDRFNSIILEIHCYIENSISASFFHQHTLRCYHSKIIKNNKFMLRDGMVVRRGDGPRSREV